MAETSDTSAAPAAPAPSKLRMRWYTRQCIPTLENYLREVLAGRTDVDVNLSDSVEEQATTEAGIGDPTVSATTVQSASALQQCHDGHDVVFLDARAEPCIGADPEAFESQWAAERARQRAITTTAALMDALHVYGATKVGLFSAFGDDLTTQICQALAEQGVNALPVNLPHDSVGSATQVSTVIGSLLQQEPELHACVVLGAEPLLPVDIEQLECVHGLPVLDSATALLWQALRLGGGTGNPGAGTLLRDGMVRAQMQRICEDLLVSTGGDRTTLRIDIDKHGLHIDTPAAEAANSGVRHIRHEKSLHMRQLDTVAWLEAERSNLLQPDFGRPPFPPKALIEVYGVQAQMLGPVILDGHLTGFLSVHSLSQRAWTARDEAALNGARTAVESLLGRLGD
ncbi:GAF domain-containing protein [Rhodococcus sp. NPDC057529]|uniref:GAF domain-containing protein n=1 Tax=Rhodococcus sp. NPDC057529 TaxID=3346158 RepID=UPI003670391E